MDALQDQATQWKQRFWNSAMGKDVNRLGKLPSEPLYAKTMEIFIPLAGVFLVLWCLLCYWVLCVKKNEEPSSSAEEKKAKARQPKDKRKQKADEKKDKADEKKER